MNNKKTDHRQSPGRNPGVALRLTTALLATLGLMLIGATTAFGATPFWHIRSEAAPTTVPPGGEGSLVVQLTNLGDAPIEGAAAPVAIADSLPPGLVATEITGGAANHIPVECSVATLNCSFKGPLFPYEQLTFTLKVKSQASPGTVTTLPDQVTVSGGGAPPASKSLSVSVSDAPTPFGITSFSLEPFNEDGTPATQAGAHPFELTTSLALNQFGRQPVELAKDLNFQLPPGLIGNPTAVEQCTMTDFFSLVLETNLCSPRSVVGVATVTANEPKFGHIVSGSVPVFNLVPAQGEPARIGFEVIGKIPIVIDTAVRSGGNYSVVAKVENATQTAGLLSSEVTLWGVPGATTHDSSRGWECVANGTFSKQVGKPCPASPGLEQRPFLRLPTSCAASPALEPVTSSVEADSWGQPGNFTDANYEWISSTSEHLGFEGCGKLPFAPTVAASAEEHATATPSGLSVSVRVPQASTLEPEALAEADVRNSTVSLPEGVELSPSAANELGACSESQIGFTGFGSSGAAEFSTAPPSCPDASKLGTVHVRTPLLEHELEGSAYLAAQNQNPFGSLIAIYIYAKDPISGVWIKLAGKGELNETTGQVSTTFSNTPQVPFEELKLDVFGGQRASVSTPITCGAYSPLGAFTPWSSTNATTANSEGFTIDEGVGGGPCPATVPFAPGFAAQSLDTQAGAFTPFSVDITRPDGDQALTGVSVHLPPGIAAVLSSVTPCPEPPPGLEWSCGPASLIGHSTASSGLGTEPVTLPGDVYLTTGYDGAPFGILVRTHAAAGPFDLGYVNVRSRINVNPADASVTITTDPGPHGDSLPVRVKGIPAQIKALQISVDRPNFEFNPTSCDPSVITSTLSGDRGATAPNSSRFQVGGCEQLPFAPKLSASVAGKGSRVDGTTFTVKLESAGLGQANIHKVQLQLPKVLPSRLETLKKACLAATFEANPATCGPESVIGTATIHTPVLKNPLAGPAYLVSHGNAAFPDVEFVLQGEGIVLIVDGQTDIKGGVTYSKFESAPDAPFTSFETVLPAGPKSVLAVYNEANKDEPYSVCGTKLTMPTTIISQDNKVIETDTPVTTTGCGAVKNNKTVKPSLRQRYLKALHACRIRYKHSKTKRAACEHKTHTTYTAKALAACRKTHKRSRPLRKSCETTERRAYALRRT